MAIDSRINKFRKRKATKKLDAWRAAKAESTPAQGEAAKAEAPKK